MSFSHSQGGGQKPANQVETGPLHPDEVRQNPLCLCSNVSIFLSLFTSYMPMPWEDPGGLHSQYSHNFASTSTKMSGILTQAPAGGLVAKLDSLNLIRFCTMAVTQRTTKVL